jgi:hypothetical protein
LRLLLRCSAGRPSHSHTRSISLASRPTCSRMGDRRSRAHSRAPLQRRGS